jgi:hypothetical protein
MDQYFVHQGAVIDSLEEPHGLLLLTAEVCNQKTEVDEGVEALFTDFFNDLECFCWPSVPIFSMGYDQKDFCHVEGHQWRNRISVGKRSCRREGFSIVA